MSIHQLGAPDYRPGDAFRHAMAHERPIYLHYDARGCYAVTESQRTPTREELIAGCLSIPVYTESRDAEGNRVMTGPTNWSDEKAAKCVDAVLGYALTEEHV
jgi:hypothetical protein